MALVGLNSVGLHVADVEASLAFYRDLLGLQPRFDSGWTDEPALINPGATPGASLRVVGLTLPGTLVMLSLCELRDVPREAVRPRFQDPGALHVSLRVDDLDGLLSRLADGGFVSLAAPSRHERGPSSARLVFVPDPDGFLVELVQITEG
jgi:glyoxylase I family protein